MLKYASAAIMTADLAPKGASRRELRRFAHRHHFKYEVRPGYLYVRSRAISSRCNDNFDEFPAEELEKAYATFKGKPVFINHMNHDHKRARGVIIDAALHKDANRDGSKDWWVEVLMEVDAVRFPKLAKEILAGNIARTSMGCDVAFSVCSACGNKATTPAEYCQHIPGSKGMMLYRTTASGHKVGEIIRETCYGLRFFENSLLVEPPADPTAFFLGVDTRGLDKTAASVLMDEEEAAHALPDLATRSHAVHAQHTASLDGVRAKRINLADLGRKAQAMRKKAISDEEIQKGLNLPTSEQGKNDLHQEKVKNLGDSLMASFYEPYGGEEGYHLHRTNEDMMDLHRRYEGGDGKFGFGHEDEGGEAYYQIDHRNPQGKKTGWFIRHYADGPNAEIGHEATPGETHEMFDVGENTYGPNSAGPFGHTRPPEQFGHQHLKKLLDNWHNNVDEDGEEQGGTREYLEKNDPRIRRYKRINRLAYGEQKAPMDVDTLREDACPVCGDRDTFDGDMCQVCGYVAPPKIFQDPDLEKARQMDLRKDIAEFNDPANPNPQLGPDGQPVQDPMDPAALDENGNPINPDAADQEQQPGTLPGEVQAEVQPGGDPMDPNALGEDGQIPDETGAPLDPSMLGPDGQPLPQQQMTLPDGTPIGPQELPADATTNMGQPFTPGPNMPEGPGEPEGPEGPLTPDELDEDGQPLNPDAGQGVPGTPGDGVADLMCPACGFTAEAAQPTSIDMDTQQLPNEGAAGMDGVQAGDVCPNCGSAQLLSPAEVQGEAPVPTPV